MQLPKQAAAVGAAFAAKEKRLTIEEREQMAEEALHRHWFERRFADSCLVRRELLVAFVVVVVVAAAAVVVVVDAMVEEPFERAEVKELAAEAAVAPHSFVAEIDLLAEIGLLGLCLPSVAIANRFACHSCVQLEKEIDYCCCC